MVRIDCLIFGYRKITLSPEDLSTATSLLLRRGIYSKFNSDGTITVRERDIDKVKAAFGMKFEYQVSDMQGLYGIYRKTRSKTAIFLGAFIILILCIISANTVWDVRVDGNERIPDSAVVHLLSECGFSVGDSWIFSDTAECENSFLSASPDISWININRRGSVAYVTVIEKAKSDSVEEAPKTGYANVIAAYDGVIEEITVTRGVAMVKPGDVVKAGDLLISGIIPDELGGGYCYAEGRVSALMEDTLEVNVSRNYEKSEKKSEKILTLTLKIFNFSINLFKKYGNQDEECDIIEDKDSFSLFGKCKLPIEIISTYAPTYEKSEASYTDTELVEIASSRLSSKLHLALLSSDLMKIKTYGEYTDDGYRMSSDILYSTDIGKEAPFSVE